MTGPALVEKARSLYNHLGIKGTFNASRGWLTRFKYWNGISLSRTQSMKVNADGSIALAFKMNFRDVIQQQELSPEQIYIASEMGLQWKDLPSNVGLQEDLGPSRTYNNTENITIMCCANASGAHTLPLLCVGMIK
jgi:hypothetical protein